MEPAVLGGAHGLTGDLTLVDGHAVIEVHHRAQVLCGIGRPGAREDDRKEAGLGWGQLGSRQSREEQSRRGKGRGRVVVGSALGGRGSEGPQA